MENKKVLNIAIGLVAIAALIIIVISVFRPSITPTKVPIIAGPPVAIATPKPVLTAPPTATSKPSVAPTTTAPTNPPTASSVPASATPGITQPPTTAPATSASSGSIPTITNGPEYPTNFAEEGFFIKPLAGTPVVSREVALKAIFSHGVSLTIVSDHQILLNGKTTLYTAYYGLVTIGYRIPNGLWAGSFLNTHVSNCTVDGKCVETGEVLDHIENRPMWLIDLQTDVAIAGVTCPPAGTPCPTVRDDNHAVDVVDAQTLMFLGGMSYYQP